MVVLKNEDWGVLDVFKKSDVSHRRSCRSNEYVCAEVIQCKVVGNNARWAEICVVYAKNK